MLVCCHTAIQYQVKFKREMAQNTSILKAFLLVLVMQKASCFTNNLLCRGAGKFLSYIPTPVDDLYTIGTLGSSRK